MKLKQYDFIYKLKYFKKLFDLKLFQHKKMI